ncbi:MAG TPA: hypothetical protein VFX76_18975, partial [Roseiflexaceae bacterium]|nr:hypothetical protein [Roseiflexaceae bacterium]
LQRFNLQQPTVNACFAPYTTALHPLALGPTLPQYWRLPTSQEVAEGDGWRFERFAMGWQGKNIGAEQFAESWRFVPSSDPSLASPLLNLDAQRYRALEIRLAHTTQARDAQLFFAGPDGAIDEAHSVRWTLEPTTQMTTYRIEVAENPAWNGTITRLRLDPIGVGDGGEVRVESIRLVPR